MSGIERIADGQPRTSGTWSMADYQAENEMLRDEVDRLRAGLKRPAKCPHCDAGGKYLVAGWYCLDCWHIEALPGLDDVVGARAASLQWRGATPTARRRMKNWQQPGMPPGLPRLPPGLPHGLPHGILPGLLPGLPQGLPQGMLPGLLPGLPNEPGRRSV